MSFCGVALGPTSVALDVLVALQVSRLRSGDPSWAHTGGQGEVTLITSVVYKMCTHRATSPDRKMYSTLAKRGPQKASKPRRRSQCKGQKRWPHALSQKAAPVANAWSVVTNEEARTKTTRVTRTPWLGTSQRLPFTCAPHMAHRARSLVAPLLDISIQQGQYRNSQKFISTKRMYAPHGEGYSASSIWKLSTQPDTSQPKQI